MAKHESTSAKYKMLVGQYEKCKENKITVFLTLTLTLIFLKYVNKHPLLHLRTQHL